VTEEEEALRDPDTLGMSVPEMRRLAHWVVDRVVDHFEHGDQGPAIHVASPPELNSWLGGKAPEEPGDPEEALQVLVDVALANMQHGDHPRYFARVPSPSSFAAVLGDWLGTGFNAIASSWAGGSGPATVELVVLEWLRQLIGLPEGTEGVFTSGGSLANATALIVARNITGPGVAYLSDQTHASIGRGLTAIGFPLQHIRVLPTDADYRMDVMRLEEAVLRDRAAGLRPGFVVATAGTVNSGVVDPLDDLADFCSVEGLWFHVDGAYGAPAALSDRGRAVLGGLNRADSLALDPHKWLFQPYDMGSLFVRRIGALTQTFSMTPEYLIDATGGSGEVDLRDRSLELSRRARALKLWLTITVYGLERIRSAITRGIELAEYAESVLRDDARWEVATSAQLGIVTFTRSDADDDAHAAAAAALAEDGYAVVTSTKLREKSVLRLCTINPRTTEEDIKLTLDRLAMAFG
jgi:aromatic-L-amino-acid decarboxylase